MFVLSGLFLLLSVLGQNFALDNGLALTPPMGWLTWQRFRCDIDCENHPKECISEDLIKSMADRMAADGYLDVGYEYIIVDDCWASKERDSEGRLQGDPDRFPSGIPALADYVHGKGLKFGIYGDYGTLTCGGYPGSLEYLELDAQTWADWGVDYLKLDGCYVETEGMEEGYGQMSRYLNATGRPIVFSCSFPAYLGSKTNYSAGVEYCNLWRNYNDIDDSFESVKDIVNWFSDRPNLTEFAGPGHWNDPDMLLIGNYGLSLEQSKLQMTIWAILAAPLIMSVDLRTILPQQAAILQHPDLIKINQDPLGRQGIWIESENDINTWARLVTSDDGKECYAIAFASYRITGNLYDKKFKLSSFDFINGTTYSIKNVWEPEEFTVNVEDEIVARVKPTGVQLYIVCPAD